MKPTKIIKRYISPQIETDLAHKMVFVAGPRQVGKTTMAKSLLKQTGQSEKTHYLNWDTTRDRENIIRERFPSPSGLLVLDEIHKFSNWRQVIKGLFDKRGRELQILVTGSARLDYYRHGGDSLQGRYHFHRLHPLSMAELDSDNPNDLEALLMYGGFPEPFLRGSQTFSRRWHREYRSHLIREDLRDLERVKDISLIEMLALRLPDLVGSPLSINALREDLQVSHQTVSRWISILEKLYMVFRIYPFGAPKIRAVKKEAKLYHLDWAVVKNSAARFENLVACHLLKWCHWIEDTQGKKMELRYFRDIDRREVDFVITEESHPIHFIECKSSDGRSANLALKYLKKRFPQVTATQLVMQKNIDHIDRHNIRHQSAGTFLQTLI